MGSPRTKKWLIIIASFCVLCISLFVIRRPSAGPAKPAAHRAFKLYWFIPDGFRADPDLFDIYKWANEGKLPNVKRMMDEGSYGFSIPFYPTHTPVNYAALMTGVSPIRNGVPDGPIRIFGYPLNMVARSGCSSLAKTIDPLWYTLEQAGMVVTLMTVPGSTPPEIENGYVIKGRWGGWGVDFPNLIFHTAEDGAFRQLLGWNAKVFQIEKRLTDFVHARAPRDWQAQLPKSFSPLREINMRAWDADLYGLIADSTDDGVENYDTLYVSKDKKAILFALKVGQWSDWFPIRLYYEMDRNYQDEAPQRMKVEQELSRVPFDLQAKLRVIKLGKKDFFRIRLLYDGLNDSLTLPQSLNAQLHKATGPMVDFVDNYPPQLVYFPEDKKVFEEESNMSFDWHEKAQNYMLDHVNQDVYIQSIYSPNQMLTSRWWMPYLDSHSIRYKEKTEAEREKLWHQVRDMYRRVDKMLGDALDRAGPDSYVVLSSDHGAAPLNYEVRLNNLFAKKGWLKFYYDRSSQILKIDWAKTKVIFLKMDHVYINPKGLAGDYYPAHGPAYEHLRQQVIETLQNLKDKDGVAPLAAFRTREKAYEWGLPGNRIGDIVIANAAGYNWIEDVSEDLKVFVPALKGGYKQAILPLKDPAVWTPFMVVGPGIKKGYRIPQPISHLDQYPTILKMLGVKPTYKTDHPPLEEIFVHP